MTTEVFALAAALVLTVVFVAAGLGKLIDRAGTRKAVGEFGAPKGLIGPLALVLPPGELAVAIALLLPATRMVGAVGALGLLVLFSAAVAASLARGRAPDCHCFGQLHSSPASWKTLVRNGVLAGLAIVAVAGGTKGPSAVAWITELTPLQALALTVSVVVAGLVVAGGLAFVSLTQSYGRVLLRIDTLENALRVAGIDIDEDDESLPALGIDPGSPAPAFVAESARGGQVSLDSLLEPQLPLLLLFTSPSCGPCRALQPVVAGWQKEHESFTLAILSSGEHVAIRAEAEEHGLENVLLDPELTIFETYQANGTPGAVLISPSGEIASYVASGSDEIEQLVERALAGFEEAEEDGLAIGTPASELGLTGLEGEPISFANAEGNDTLVLFWNPGCGYCQSMLDDLHGWERDIPAGAPRLLVISSGDEAATRADGFASTVALDPGYTAGEEFGARGTPMAVLLDSSGRVASGLAAGGEAVMALATSRRTQLVVSS